MADTTVHADNQVTVYESDYWMEYVRESGFMQYMSTSVNAIIQTNRDPRGVSSETLSVMPAILTNMLPTLREDGCGRRSCRSSARYRRACRCPSPCRSAHRSTG